jgi:hypothetical protein
MADASAVASGRNVAITTAFGRLGCCNCLHYTAITVASQADLYLSEYPFAGSIQYEYPAERPGLNFNMHAVR